MRLPTGLLALGYYVLASIIALVVVKITVIFGGASYAGILYCVGIGGAFLLADSAGRRFHNVRFYLGFIPFWIAGILFILLGIMLVLFPA